MSANEKSSDSVSVFIILVESRFAIIRASLFRTIILRPAPALKFQVSGALAGQRVRRAHLRPDQAGLKLLTAGLEFDHGLQ